MPKELRPSEIIWGYWAEVLALEETAIRLDVEYIKGEQHHEAEQSGRDS